MLLELILETYPTLCSMPVVESLALVEVLQERAGAGRYYNLNHASGVPVQDLLHRSRYGADKAFLGVLSREPWGSATASICMQRSRLEISRAAAGYST